MKDKKLLLLSFLSTAVLSINLLNASEDTNLTKNKDWIVLPYIFSSDSTGFSGGIGVIKQGVLQPQTTLATSVFGGITQDITINGKAEEANFSGGAVSFSDFKLPYTNRLFFSLLGIKSYFPKGKYFFDGSNNSNKDNVLITSEDSNFFYTTLRYILPIGEGLENPEGLYTLQDGFAVGVKCNPKMYQYA
jgi:hypothetical protein